MINERESIDFKARVLCWVICQGEYSDFTVNSVWTNKEDAERACAFLNEPYDHVVFELAELFLNDIAEPLSGWGSYKKTGVKN